MLALRPAVALLAVTSVAVAQYQRPTVTSPNPLTTRQDNIVTPYAELPISPLQNVVKSPAVINAYTGVLNHRRGRYEIYYFNSALNQQVLIDDLALPPGATAAVERPGTVEIWLTVPNSRIGVDPATGVLSPGGAVIVFDPVLATPVRSIAVGVNPSGIAFHPSGSHAYVSCRGSRDIHIIDCSTGVSVGSVDLDQYTPHAITYVPGADRILVASLLSGNNTVARRDVSATSPTGMTPMPVTVTRLPDPLVTGQLPDRDVVALRVSPTNPASVGVTNAQLATGVMTIQYAIEADPVRSRAYVVGTEALNDQFVGEKNFVAGQVVENRLVMLDYSGGGTPTATTVNLDASSFAPMATPTDFVVDPSARRGWLVARGVDRVVEFRLGTGAPVAVGAWDLASADPNYGPSLVGARNATLNIAGDELYVYCEIENSFAVLDVSGAAPTTPTTVTTSSLTYDPLPEFGKRGWAHLSDANRSLSQTSSCYSCHVDGGQDNLVWELSAFHDPEGTPAANLDFEVDLKGPMLTQSLFGLPETAPYHWRGEKRTLANFNGAFAGLLEGTLLTPSEVTEMVDFIGLMRHAPNRHLAMDRDYTNTTAPAGVGNVGQGLVDFETFPVVGALNCVTCHSLPTGTNNELQRISIVGPPTESVQVAQLRGVVNRLDATMNLGPFVGERCRNGAGLIHQGDDGGFNEFVAQPVFTGLQGPATQGTRDNLVAFLDAMDTGLAPSSSFVCVLRTDYANPTGDYTAAMNYVKAEAAAGHADFSTIISLPNGAGFTSYTGYWDDSIQAWIGETQNLAPTSEAGLLAIFLASGQPLTIMGHPPGSGQRFSIDADDDAVLDLDEVFTNFTLPYVSDTDGDGRPDGYELALGENPLAVDPPTDSTAPNTVGSPRLMYSTTNTVKIELNTDEVASVRAFTTINTGSGTGLFPLEGQFSPAPGGFSTNHQIVLHHLPSRSELPLLSPVPLVLPPGVGLFQVDLELTDPAGNSRIVPFIVPMADKGIPLRMQQIDNAVYTPGANTLSFDVSLMLGTTIVPLPLPSVGPPGSGTPTWGIGVELAYGTQPGGPGTQILGLTKLFVPGTVPPSSAFPALITAATNPATYTVALPASAATDTNRVLTVTVLDVIDVTSPGTSGVVYVESQGFERHHAVLQF